MADPNAEVPEGFVVIHINKQSHAGPVRGGVNGRTFELPTGSDQTVPKWVAQALTDTHYDFTVVKGSLDDGEGGAEGSAPPSNVLTKTAIRGEPALADGVAGTPMHVSLLNADPPMLGAVGGAQSGSAGQPQEGTGATKPPAGKPEGGSEEKRDTFDADAFVNRTLEDIEADGALASLTPEQRQQVAAAEQRRNDPRVGLADLLDKAGNPREDQQT